MSGRPKIVCLCGSSRFIGDMAVLAWKLEKEGNVVLAMHLLPFWYTSELSHQAEAEGIAAQMDALHLKKIDMADLVFVLNIGGYYGESTEREIAYARAQGKPITFAFDVERVSEPPTVPPNPTVTITDEDKLEAWRAFYNDGVSEPFRDPRPDDTTDQITAAGIERILELDRRRVAERLRGGRAA